MSHYNNSLETIVLKWTFGAVFAGVTVLFGIKVIALLGTAITVKTTAMLAYLKSGQAVTDLGIALWNIIKTAMTGG